jgi:anti-sigma B factor antagonist
VLNTEVEGTAPRVVSSEPWSARGATVIVDVDLDVATAPQLERHIIELVEDGHRHLVIDLAAATFLDSTAMRSLVTTIAPLRDDPSTAVVLAGAHGIVDRALTVSGIGQMFTAFDTRRAAIECLAGRAPALQGGWRSVARRPTA